MSHQPAHEDEDDVDVLESSLPLEREEEQPPLHVLARFLRRTRQLASQLTLSEISGSFGDLGTFIPLYAALGQQRAIYVAPALFLAGLSNLVTGYAWDVPMPVQPMKTIAAVALVEGLTRAQVTTAGIWMGILLLLLGLTNGIDLLHRIIPVAVVSGIQMGVGFSLALHGVQMIAVLPWASQMDSITLAVATALVSLYFLREPHSEPAEDETGTSRCRRILQRPPIGILLFAMGGVLALMQMAADHALAWSVAPVLAWGLGGVTTEDWSIGFFQGALPQVPLSTLNSVISVCCLAHSLYPEKRAPGLESDAVLSRRNVCTSVGLMNLVLCPLGAMPNCHGAGGLAGQHKFGARHGASVAFLGLGKMLLAVAFGGSVLAFLDRVPSSILGVMLAISGHALALTGVSVLLESQDEASHRLRANLAVSLATALLILGLKKTHYGALGGWLMHMIYGNGCEDCRRRRPGRSTASYRPVLEEQDDDDGPATDDDTHPAAQILMV